MLKEDGFAMMTMPDLQQAAQMIAECRLMETIYESTFGQLTPFDMVFGHSVSIERGHVNVQHRTGFSKERIIHDLACGGFERFSCKKSGANL